MRTFLAFILLLSTAYAHPPHHQFYEWFRKQHSVKGAWCCSETDGHTLTDVEWRIRGGYYEVLIEGQWIRILPDQMVDTKGENPVGAAVWYVKTADGKIHIYCFAPGMLF